MPCYIWSYCNENGCIFTLNEFLVCIVEIPYLFVISCRFWVFVIRSYCVFCPRCVYIIAFACESMLVSAKCVFNILRPKSDRYFAGYIFKYIFVNEYYCVWFKCHGNLFLKGLISNNSSLVKVKTATQCQAMIIRRYWNIIVSLTVDYKLTTKLK